MTAKESFNWEEQNPIKDIQELLGAMQNIEQNFYQAKKAEEELNNRQSDLLHALELDLDEEELEAVNKALRENRLQRRDIKDIIINLAEAKELIVENRRFMNSCNETIKKMNLTSQKLSKRKYFLRDCEAISSIIKMEKYSECIHTYVEERKKTHKSN